MSRPIEIDWNQVEADYRAGIKPVRQIAKEYGERNGKKITHQAIMKHFKQLNISRDLQPQIREKAKQKLTEILVTDTTKCESGKTLKLSESQIVDVKASELAHLQVSHRGNVGQNKSLILKLLGELEFQTDNQELYGRLADLIDQDFKVEDGEIETRSQQEARYKLRTMYNKALGTAGRIDSVKKLTEALRGCIELERKLWGIDTGGFGDESLESGLAQVKAAENKRLDELPNAT